MYSSPVPSRLASPRPDYNQQPTTITSQQQPSMDSSTHSQPATRLMQVKVLYTFDDDGKSNCLARCPQPVSIQTAFLDANTEVGIIELRTCIQAIVTASPELLAKLGKDYTVYAYDYSEYETPMVGQGMLSWVLASASSTPMAPAEVSRTMVTGRVSKAPGLFSSSPRETLEVKLRLVPVPTSLQSEYAANMEKFRDTSNVLDHGEFDAAAWTDFLRHNPGFGDNAPSPAATDTPMLENDGSSQQPLWPLNSAQPFSTDLKEHTPALDSIRPSPNVGKESYRTSQQSFTSQTSHQNDLYPRSTTPLQNPPRRLNPPSRPASRASVGQPLEEPISRRGSISGPPEPAVYSSSNQDLEDGSCRKRVKTEKADWRGPSNFVSNNEPLRVTASAAASMRGHRLSTTAAELSAGDPINRPPTPRPHSAIGIRKPSILSRSISMPQQDTISSKESTSLSTSYGVESLPSAMSSPEKQESLASTPQDIPSSPPVLAHPSPTPSSPALPQHPPTRFQDSGFASGGFDEYYEEDARQENDEDLPMAPPGGKKRQTSGSKRETKGNGPPQVKRTMSELSILEETPGDPSLLPRKILPRPLPPPSRRRISLGRADSSLELSTKRPAPPRQASEFPPLTSDIGTLPHEPSFMSEMEDMPTDFWPTTDAIQEGDEMGRGRSVSYAADDGSQANSPPNIEDSNKPNAELAPVRKGGYGSGSSMKRKRAIQRKLATALAEGRMPPFCKNCGAIQTPTWRKAFIKVYEGSMEDIKIPGGEGGHMAWEPVTKDEDGNITSYRIIKKSLTSEDEGFEETQLCNPCGIWFFKFKSMRPSDKWDPPPRDKEPRKRPPRKKPSARDGGNSIQSEPVQQPPESDAGEVDDQPDQSEESQHEHLNKPENNEEPKDLQLNPPLRLKRANSMNFSNDLPVGEWKPPPIAKTRGTAAAALQRAIQSSPPRFPGSKFSPIEIDTDLTPRPTRRVLFPSPRRPGEIKSLKAPNLDGSPSKASNLDEANCDHGTSDKENEPQASSLLHDSDDDIHLLFNSQPRKKAKFTVPVTPKSALRTRQAPETPTSSAKRRLMTPKDILSSASKRMGSAFETPTRRNLTLSADHSQVQMSPFTAQLTKLISESNHHFSPGRSQAALEMSLDDAGMFAFSDFSMDGLGSMLDMPAPVATSPGETGFLALGSSALGEENVVDNSDDAVWSDAQGLNLNTADIDVLMSEASGPGHATCSGSAVKASNGVTSK